MAGPRPPPERRGERQGHKRRASDGPRDCDRIEFGLTGALSRSRGAQAPAALAVRLSDYGLGWPTARRNRRSRAPSVTHLFFRAVVVLSLRQLSSRAFRTAL